MNNEDAPSVPQDAARDPPAGWLRVCAGSELVEGGDGRRFELPPGQPGGQAIAAFVIRYDGLPRAWLNQCAHMAVELDWLPGKFFDDGGLYLICAMHGAAYAPDTGLCVDGPCKGARLLPVRVREHEGSVWIDAASPAARHGAPVPLTFQQHGRPDERS